MGYCDNPYHLNNEKITLLPLYSSSMDLRLEKLNLQ